MKNGKSIVILGAGFGGITAAVELRQHLGAEHQVILLDRKPAFMMGLRKLWVLTGRGTRAEGTRPFTRLRDKGIDFRQATVSAIETRTRVVKTDVGDMPFDLLLVAVGAEPRRDMIPGYSAAVFNLYDPDEVERLARRVRDLTQGRVVIGIGGLPYKCPPAPYEAAMLLDEFFRQRKVRDRVELAVFTPQPMSLPVVGPAGCARVEAQLARKGIQFLPNHKAVRLDGSTAVMEGPSLPSDVLIIVPPHRPPAFVRDSGLRLRGDWVAVDRQTLRTSVEGIFAVGDVTEIPLANQMALPKAGMLAEGQGKVAAAAIVAELTGGSPSPPYDGKGYCFIEMGEGRAAMVVGDFLATPAPHVEITDPTVDAYRQKEDFERTRLAAWF